MARILVIARRSSLAMGLSNTDHEIVDVRPDAVDDALSGDNPPDACVLGLDDPADALDFVSTVRAASPDLPVLLVSSAAPGWSAVRSVRLEAVEVVPLPVTRPALLESLARLLEPVADIEPEPEPAPAPPPPRAPEPPAPEPGVPADTAPPTQEPGDVQPVEARTEPARTNAASPYGGVAAARLSTKPRPSHAPGEDEDLLRLRTPTEASARPARSTAAAHPPDAPAAKATKPARTHQRTPSPESTIHLVRLLLTATEGLVSLADVADLVVAEAVARTSATAGVLMLPDDDAWRVSGGMRLRPLELRCRLDEDSWLVQTVAHGDRGVIIEHTDIARQRLHGAPLANRQQLLAAPVLTIEGVLLVARDEQPFSEAELEALAAVGQEAADPLREALDIRRLARQLEDLRDHPL